MTPPDELLAESGVKVILMGTEPLPASAQGALLALLGDAERERFRRLRYEKLGREYLYAHALLRVGLSSIRPVVPSRWRFGRDHLGRPHIDFPRKHTQLSFSLSHTVSLVGCALRSNGVVGFDVESIDPIDVENTADFVFSQQEKQAWLALATTSERISRFYRLWTIKEALLKAAGIGLLVSPSAISIEMGQAPLPVIRELPRELGQPANWKAVELYAGAHHVAAVAVKSDLINSPPIRCERIDPRALMSILRTQEPTLFGSNR